MHQHPRQAILRTVGVVAALVAAASAGLAPVAAAQAPEPVSPAEAEAIIRARRDSAAQRFTEADVRFMTGMISHHAQALAMAAYAPTNGASGPVRTLAARIINAQLDEIAGMQVWLRDRGQPVPELHGTGTGVMVHGAGEHHHMPGMLSEAQMAELAVARGEAFDRLFLTYMIQHHRGAVAMVDDLLASGGAAADRTVFKFASDVQVDQSTEIARMERMLAALPPAAPSR